MIQPAYHLDQELLHQTRRHLTVLEATQEKDRSDSPILDDPPACVASSAEVSEPSVDNEAGAVPADGLTAKSQSGASDTTALDDCIRWWGAARGNGYGGIFFRTEEGKRGVLAHRHIWEQCIGPLDTNDVLHHKCHNPWCVNPNHLEVLTASEHGRIHARPEKIPNSDWLAHRTHCKNGHEFTLENTRWRGRVRVCRACQRDYARARYAETKARTEPSGMAALDSSLLKTMVRRAIDLHGRKRMGWTSREKAAWHELVVVRGGSV